MMTNLLLGRKSVAAAGALLCSFMGAQFAVADEPVAEGGVDLIYQEGTTIDFKGGTTAKLDSDYGFSLVGGYRLNPRVTVQGALDWARVNYDASIVTAAGGSTAARGTYQAFTPRINVLFNLMTRPFTPYVMGGIGYSFIDTNIPNGRPQTGCYWDPWYGYICATVQSTKRVDGFAYQVGAGLRFDFSEVGTVRVAYERHWVDFGSQGSPYLDQIKLGFSVRR
jgi:opacity protein-like surface antigen